MQESASPESQGNTLLDPAYVIGLLRAFLPSPLHSSNTPGHPDSLGAETTVLPSSREQAGEELWDLAASSSHASLLVTLQLVSYAPALVQEALQREDVRLVELTLGILGNLSCHGSTVAAVADSTEIRQLMMEALMELEDAAALTEACRLASSCISQHASAELLSNIRPAYSR